MRKIQINFLQLKELQAIIIGYTIFSLAIFFCKIL